MSNNLRRILTAVVAAPLVVGGAYLGGWPFAVLVAGVGLLGQRELYQMARAVDVAPHRPGGFLLGGLLVATFAEPAFWPAPAVVLVGLVVGAPFLLPQPHFLLSLTTTLAGAVYPTGLLGSLVLLRTARTPQVDDQTAFFLVLITLLLVWATDIFAYYVGKGVGRRPLAPAISPNKTWEGTLGGLAAAALVAVGAKLTVLGDLNWIHLGMLTLIGGGIGQIGDLTESQLKRSTDTDDSSSVLPGHGGLLDRFDAMAVAAPLIYLYLHVVAGLV